MKISITRFIIIFVISAFVFQFMTNTILGPEVRGVPVNGQWFPGTDSPVAWKRTVASIIYPIKVVLVGPWRLYLMIRIRYRRFWPSSVRYIGRPWLRRFISCFFYSVSYSPAKKSKLRHRRLFVVFRRD